MLITLARGLAATREIARPDPKISFQTAVIRGVSSNLLNSLSIMADSDELRGLHISFQWSPAETIAPPGPTEVILPQEQFSRFKSTAEQLKRLPEIEQGQVVLFGRVVRLDVDDDKVAPNQAIVTVRGVTGKSDRRQARMLLSGENYDRAYRALNSRRPILVTGALEKTQGHWWIKGDVKVEDTQTEI